MTDTGFHAAGRRFDLGRPEFIPSADLAEKYARLGALSKERNALAREEVVAEEAIRDAINASPADVAARLWAGEDVDDEIGADVANVGRLRVEHAEKVKRLRALHTAETIGSQEVLAALDADADAIAKAALTKAKSLKAKLVMVDQAIGEAMDVHDSTMGLVHLLEARAAGDTAATAVRHVANTPQVNLSLAHEHVRQALAMLVAELDAATASLKPSKGKKTPKPAEPAVEAPAVAREPSAPVPAPALPVSALGSLSIGEDDDE